MNVEISKQELVKTFNLLRAVLVHKPTFERVTYSLCAAYVKALSKSLGVAESLISWTVGAGREIIFRRYDTSENGVIIEVL